MQTKQSFSQKITYWLKVVSLGIVLGLGLQFAQAWTAPTQAPPAGNVTGPITTGGIAQVKSGGLGVGSLSVTGGTQFIGKNNCDLKTDASGILSCGVDAVGGGSTYTAGSGINITGTVISATGTADNLGNHTATANLQMSSRDISNVGNIYANRFYDNNDPTYYADPGGNSVMNNLYLVNWLGITGSGSPRVEIRSTNSGTPYIDFSNDSSTNFDGRIILTGDDALQISGANLGIGKNPTEALDVNGKIKMASQTVAGDAADIVATKGYVDGKVGSAAPGSVVAGCGVPAYGSHAVVDRCVAETKCWGSATLGDVCPAGTMRYGSLNIHYNSEGSVSCGGMFVCVKN